MWWSDPLIPQIPREDSIHTPCVSHRPFFLLFYLWPCKMLSVDLAKLFNYSKSLCPCNSLLYAYLPTCGSKKGVSLTLKNSLLIPTLPWVVAELSGVDWHLNPNLFWGTKESPCFVLATQKPLCPHSFRKRCQNATQTLAPSTKSHVRNTLILTNYGQWDGPTL